MMDVSENLYPSHDNRTVDPPLGGADIWPYQQFDRATDRADGSASVAGAAATPSARQLGSSTDSCSEPPIQDQRLMGAQHLGYLLHRFESAAHGPEAPIVEKAAGPDHGFVLPEIGEDLLQLPSPCGGQLAGQQGIELLPSSSAYATAAA